MQIKGEQASGRGVLKRALSLQPNQRSGKADTQEVYSSLCAIIGIKTNQISEPGTPMKGTIRALWPVH